MKLKCKFQFIKYLNLGKLYSCHVTNARIIKRGTIITAFQGEHAPGKSNEDVEVLTITHTTVRFFPRGLSKIFPNLRVVEIYDCGLQSISREDLTDISGLKAICLNSCLMEFPMDLEFRKPRLDHVIPIKMLLEKMHSKPYQPFGVNLSRALFIIDPSYNGNLENDNVEMTYSWLAWICYYILKFLFKQ